MEESNSQPDNPPTIIDLDSPDDHDLSDPNYTEDHTVDEEIEEKSPAPQTIDLDSSGHMIDEEIEEETPQTIDSDPWGQVLSEPNHTEDHVGDEEVEDENEENDESRDSDRRNLRAQRRADSPHRQHDEEENMPRDTDTSKSIPDIWGPPDSTKETRGGNNKSIRSDARDPDAKTNRREKVGRSSDAWGQQPVDRVHRSRSISPRDGYNRSHRNRSRTRSRSRSRSPSGPRRSNWRSPVGGNDRTGDWRSPVGRGNNSRTGDRRSPVGRGNDGRSDDWISPVRRGNDDRPGGDWRSPVDRGGGDWRSPVRGNDRRPAGGAQPCRDFMAGRCRRGPQCRFLHPDEREGDNNRDRERERDNRDRERGRGSSRDRERDRDRYPPPRSERDSNKDDIYDSRGQSEYSRQLPVSQGRKGNYDEPGYNYGNRSSERCFDFTRGRCKRGADCRFIHEEASGQGRRERDERERERGEREERESYRGGGGNYEEREGANSNLSRAKKEEICKFYLEGRCGRGQSCRFSHEENNSVNESSWSDSNKRDSVPSNQYMVPVTETVPVSNKIENQYNAPVPVPVQVPVPPAPVMNPYMGVNPNPNPNLLGYNSNLQNVPAINPNQMTQSLPPPPPVNPPLPPGNPPNPNTNPNPSNLVTTEQAANITDISAYLSQILATNNPTIPVPVPVQVPVPVPDKPDNPLPHESPITPPVEMETNSETKKDDPPNPNPNPNNPKVKEGKGLKLFKCALVEVVKDLLKPSWKEGQLSREVHKTIVKKVCEKVIGTLESLPPTQEKIDVYLSHSKPKLAKLVQAYVEKFVKAQS